MGCAKQADIQAHVRMNAASYRVQLAEPGTNNNDDSHNIQENGYSDYETDIKIAHTDGDMSKYNTDSRSKTTNANQDNKHAYNRKIH